MPAQHQAWVTSALTEDDVHKALILRSSLRRVRSGRQIAVIASQKLRNDSRRALSYAFELVFYVENAQNVSKIKMDDFVKIYSMVALNCFKVVIYLSPNLLALKNFDDLFETETKGVCLLENDPDISVMVLTPSVRQFEAILSGFSKSEETNFNKFFLTWTKNQNRKTCLDAKYGFVLNPQAKKVLPAYDIPIVNLKHFSNKIDIDNLKSGGIFEKAISTYWEKIQLEDVVPFIEALNSSLESLETYSQPICLNEPIAIIGMSCRYPGSDSLEEFWNLLKQGLDATRKPPEFRWLREQSYRHVVGARDMNVGFLKGSVDDFDSRFFGISPKESLFLDPQHRILHELVWEGLEDAHINPHTLYGSPGSVFVGSWINDYRDILMKSGNSEFYRLFMGNSIGACAARISFMLGLTGPSIATESGCSSAMVAVHLAIKSLRQGETNLAFACGVNMLLHPFDKDDLPMVVSPDGHSKTFSEDANGFGRAEGAGVLVLKRLSDAVRNGDHIWGLIRGSGISQEGVSKSMGTPTIHSESLAMQNALEDANLSPEQISYIETHGTGTIVGDPMEVAAIARAYHSSEREEPLVIGSVKTNIGHTESCSGITGIMKVVLSMKCETIPAHRNFTKLNPAIDLDAVPAVIPLSPMEWKKSSDKRRFAGISSFGITGTDAHVIVEEAPDILSPDEMHIFKQCARMKEIPVNILKFSAKTEEAVDLLLEKYYTHISQSDDELADISYCANTGRGDFPVRRVLIGSSKTEILKNIQQANYMKGDLERENVAKKICFLFTGQGSQYSGMAKQLYDTSLVFRMNFDYCEQFLEKNYNLKLSEVLWNESKKNDLSKTLYSQTSIFSIEYAMLKFWDSLGIKPDYVLGHSLGEFAASVCAGLLTINEALRLVAERSILIDSLPRGKMLVVKADKIRTSKLLEDFSKLHAGFIIDYAAINSNEQTVLAGDTETLKDLQAYLMENGTKCIELSSTHAFHSTHMDPILDEYKAFVQTNYKRKHVSSTCGYISGMKGELVDTEINDLNAEYWVKQTRNAVNFLEASHAAVKLGCTLFIEIGPQPILSALTLMNNDVPLVCLPTIKKSEENWQTIMNTLGKLYVEGVEINWNGLYQFQNRKKVRLPHYPFIKKKHWPDRILSSGNTIHPLLGSTIPNASSSKLFQCGINLRSHEWIKDHAIGNHVVLPGAAYLEIFLAAGCAAINGATECLGEQTLPMKIENLAIYFPLEVEESKTVQIQTLVEFNGGGENIWDNVIVKTFQRQDTTNNTNWICHSKAEFSPGLDAQDKILFANDVDLSGLQKLQSDQTAIDNLYTKLSSLGLNFGPMFRSIEKFWQHENTLVIKVKTPSDEDNQFIIHPVILDAMIQAIMLFKLSDHLKRKIYVPIRIGKFAWLSSPKPENDIFIQVFEDSNKRNQYDVHTISNYNAILLDDKGKKLAFMKDVELIDTTVRAVEAVLEQNSNPMPCIWEEIWRQDSGPCEHDVNIQSHPGFLTEEEKKSIEKYNDLTPHIAATVNDLYKFVFLNMLKALYECGWNPNATRNQDINIVELFNELKLNEQYRKQFGFFFRIFEEEGIVKRMGPNVYKITKQPITLEEIRLELTSPLYSKDLVERFRSTLLMEKVGQHLADILKGNHSVLGILFPDDKDKPSVAEFYNDYSRLLQFETMVKQLDAIWFNKLANLESVDTKKVIRILEIGAGTGGYTQPCLELLEESNTEFEYTYTDISSAFFVAAEKRFERWSKNMKFKRLNIEEDPISQGFVPGYYDYVSAADVIHATRNLRVTLRNVRTLLKPGGFFSLGEQMRVNRFVTYLFGLLEGFWHFEDFDIRPDHCTISAESWCNVLKQSGFDIVGVLPLAQNLQGCIRSRRTLDIATNPIHKDSAKQKTWIIFHERNNPTSDYMVKTMKQLATDRNVVIVNKANAPPQDLCDSIIKIRPDNEEDFAELMSNLNSTPNVQVEGILFCWSLADSSVNEFQQEILQSYFLLAKAARLLTHSVSLRFCALVKGVVSVEGCDIPGYYAATFNGFTKSLQNEHPEMKCKVIDIGAPESALDKLQIFYELWSPQKEMFAKYNAQVRYVPKLHLVNHVSKSLDIPVGVDRYQLILPETKSIRDLQFGHLEQFELSNEEIEIEIRASALNFRDIMNILKPIAIFNDSSAVGFDFGGTVKRVGPGVVKYRVGDRVFGVNLQNSALPSHVLLNENNVLAIPDDMTFCEAATLPAVVTTCIHSLFEVANICADDTVLIHAASGGVGLSAIELCKHVGAKIIATASSTRKQNYLRSLGIQHVFYSRNTEYEKQILKATQGRGVDVVLNSLTGPGFKEATLNSCAKGARFIELGKLSVWSPEEVAKLRPDVKYTIVDLTKYTESQWRELLQKMDKLIKQKIANPIPYTRFDGADIREALGYLQKAKHIGKVVCVLPELEMKSGMITMRTPMFNNNATYLITGGLGGIGFQICKWMVEMGARFVLLAGRNRPGLALQESISQLNKKYSANVSSVVLDVADYSQCETLVNVTISKMGYPSLHGVMHAAGTLNDNIIEKHSWETFTSTFKAKIDGTLNLHRVTKNISCLEHFVLFSSAAALFGPPGQSNHSAGNCFEDALAHYRHLQGLPATSINWGQWGEVGVATEVYIPGIKPFSTRQAIAALEYAIKYQRTQVGVVNIDSMSAFGKVMPFILSYIDERLWKLADGNNSNSVLASLAPEVFWKNYDAADSFDNKIKVLKDAIRTILHRVLKLEQSDIIEDNTDFQEMGVDSLMFVEIRNALQGLLGDRITVNTSALKDCNTLSLISTTLVKMIEGSPTGDDENLLTAEEVEDLIREDCILPEHIKAGKDQIKIEVQDISRVLLTGVTGTLGPYILKELCSLAQIKQVVCVVRPKKKLVLEERLKTILQERALLDEMDFTKVKCVSGNVADTRLGIEENIYQNLCDDVDAVINCAARVQHWEQYRKGDGKTDIRSINIQGLHHVLEFACTGNKLKHVYYASSIVAVIKINEAGTISEDWPQNTDYNGVTTMAYPISKFIGDILMKTSIDRGIPGKVFRFPLIVGDSKTGRFIVEQNHMMLRYFFILKTGMIPTSPAPIPMLPVDICAKVSIQLFFNPDVPCDGYNVCNRDPVADQEFINIANQLGFTVNAVEFSEFAQKVRDSTTEDSPFAIFKDFYRSDEDILALYSTTPILRQWIVDGSTRGNFFVSTKIQKYLPSFYENTEATTECILRDLTFAKQQGWLDKYVKN